MCKCADMQMKNLTTKHAKGEPQRTQSFYYANSVVSVVNMKMNVTTSGGR